MGYVKQVCKNSDSFDWHILWSITLIFILELNKNPVEGFSAGLVDDDDIYQWEVVIIGPQDTLLWVELFTTELLFNSSWAVYSLSP